MLGPRTPSWSNHLYKGVTPVSRTPRWMISPMGYLTIAEATAVRRPKQSERLAATLYSPPETWISRFFALRKGRMPGSRRWTSAPSERRSNWAEEFWGIVRFGMVCSENAGLYLPFARGEA